jgi:nucleotide-binding universal stress UspA family protein
MYETVLVPTDGSDASLTAAHEAVDITADDGVVHVLSVVEELPMYRRSGKVQKFDSDDEDTEADARRAAARVGDVIAEAEPDHETAVARGVPAREILARADEIDADAVVLGKRSTRESAGDMLGSTTERVIKDADQTVVSVPFA